LILLATLLPRSVARLLSVGSLQRTGGDKRMTIGEPLKRLWTLLTAKKI
jgi:hypothetical protein